MDNEKTIGQLAFEAYVEQVGGVTYDKKPIPTWTALSIHIQDGWHKAARRVLMFAIETDMFFSSKEGSDGKEN